MSYESTLQNNSKYTNVQLNFVSVQDEISSEHLVSEELTDSPDTFAFIHHHSKTELISKCLLS